MTQPKLTLFTVDADSENEARELARDTIIDNLESSDIDVCPMDED